MSNKKRENFSVRIKAHVLARSNNSCEICGDSTGIQIHHKDFDRSNNSEDNAQVACGECHLELHGFWTDRQQKRQDEMKRLEHIKCLKVEKEIKNMWVSEGRSPEMFGGQAFNEFFHSHFATMVSEAQ